MVAANKGNPSRKCFHEAFEAFKLLRQQHSDAILYVHTEYTGRFGGVDLPALMHDVGVPVEAVWFPDQYRMTHYPFPHSRMAEFYSAMDVLLMPSAGEGFGIPAVEAQACGVPVIASDFSAQPELLGAGWLVDGQRTYTPIGSFQFRPSIPDIFDALRQAYNAAGSDALAAKARAHAEQYDINRVLEEFMLPALEAAAGRFADRAPVAVAA
jgi:glycosyltransferase involved in cell wall biosynthesis